MLAIRGPGARCSSVMLDFRLHRNNGKVDLETNSNLHLPVDHQQYVALHHTYVPMPKKTRPPTIRFYVLLAILAVIFVAVIGRVGYLTIIKRGFLTRHGRDEAIHMRIIPAHRGVVYDRNGLPLAVSTPMDNIIFDPKQMLQYPQYWGELSQNAVLGLSREQIEGMVSGHPNLQFLYAKKNVPPPLAKSLEVMHIPGIYLQTSPSTFYPAGAADAQIVGFTDAENHGQDGIELSDNQQLKATTGTEIALESARGHILHIQKVVRPAQDGKPLYLTIDSRIQFFAYQALKKEVIKTQAEDGTVVVLDPKNGEVLAAVSYPSFNPNDPQDRDFSRVKARAMTDMLEPGSTFKPFTIAAALESGKYTPDTIIHTSPGYYFYHGNKIKDDGDFGAITVTGVLVKSSNVGVSKIALSLPWKSVYNQIIRAGFGQAPGVHFPGTSHGVLHPLDTLNGFEYATVSFGYHVDVSVLQLARAYGAIANNGILYPVTLVKPKTPPKGTRIMPAKVANEILKMLHSVTQKGGTALLANVPGFEVAGKTGTSRIAGPHGYFKHKHNAVFAGIVPVKNPRLVIIVHMNDPKKGYFNMYGGVSAAPIFSKVASESLRIMGVAPTKAKIDQSLFKDQARFVRAIASA
jgi:cell division protein FtsI (penicillin-binding protein 3)